MKAGTKFVNLYWDTAEISPKKLAEVSPMLLFMWRSHHMDALIQSSFFRLLRVEDKCYQMIVRKCSVTGLVNIKFTKNQPFKKQNHD